MTHGTQLVAHGILSGKIQKSHGDLAAIFLKYFWRRNFDLAVCSFYFLTNPFCEFFDFSGKVVDQDDLTLEFLDLCN